jgi:putative Mg2+ transporter-C (MgtC) family protein
MFALTRACARFLSNRHAARNGGRHEPFAGKADIALAVRPWVISDGGVITFDISDIALRLGAATLIGVVIGLNRDLHGKPTGVRTLGLVALASATVTLAAADAASATGTDPNALSRIMQGVLTGVGFLGAGVILHDQAVQAVRGLTTAACVWLTACLGMMCGTANWKVLLVAFPLLAVVLTVGGRVERALHRRWGEAAIKPDN